MPMARPAQASLLLLSPGSAIWNSIRGVLPWRRWPRRAARLLELAVGVVERGRRLQAQHALLRCRLGEAVRVQLAGELAEAGLERVRRQVEALLDAERGERIHLPRRQDGAAGGTDETAAG